MRDFRTTAMTGISEQDYETLLVHLGEQLAVAAEQQGSFPEGEAAKAASDALANAWDATLTGNEWLSEAGKRLGVDTSRCVGA